MLVSRFCTEVVGFISIERNASMRQEWNRLHALRTVGVMDMERRRRNLASGLREPMDGGMWAARCGPGLKAGAYQQPPSGRTAVSFVSAASCLLLEAVSDEGLHSSIVKNLHGVRRTEHSHDSRAVCSRRDARDWSPHTHDWARADLRHMWLCRAPRSN